MDRIKRDCCQSATIQDAVVPKVFRSFQLYAGEEPPRGLTTVVIQRGGVHSLGVLRVDDGGAGETLGLVAGLKVDLDFVIAPCAVWDTDDCLTARGNA